MTGSDSTQPDSPPPVKPTYLSFLDRSHARGVTDLHWLPKDRRISRKGEMKVDETSAATSTSQFVTVAGDGTLMFWDTEKRSDQSRMPTKKADEEEESRWVPLVSVPLNRPNSINTMPCTKLALGDGPDMMAVSEEGDLAVVDWASRLESEKGRPNIIQAVMPAHFQACTDVQRSPHFGDVYVTVGDTSFKIWNVAHPQPIFTSPSSDSMLTCARWGPTRPGILMTARADGFIDVWDLLDQCHKPALNFSVGSDSITSMEYWQSSTSGLQYLAVGDADGKLHIIEIPRTLRRKLAGEEELMSQFYQREVRRMATSAEGRNTHHGDGDGGGDRPGTTSGAATTQAKDDDETSAEQEAAETAYQSLLSDFKSKLCKPVRSS